MNYGNYGGVIRRSLGSGGKIDNKDNHSSAETEIGNELDKI